MKLLIGLVLSILFNLSYAHENPVTNPNLKNNEVKENTLFKLMRHTQFREVPISPEQAIKTSETIVRGHIVSITAGREVVHNNGYSNPIKTALIQVEVSKVIKGDVGKFVYFEYIVGGLPIDYLNEHKYTGELMLMLRTPTWDNSTYTFRNSPDGLMSEVDKLYTLTTQRGLFVESNAGGQKKVVQPLENADPLFLGTSFSAIEREAIILDSGSGYGFNIKTAKPKNVDNIQTNH